MPEKNTLLIPRIPVAEFSGGTVNFYQDCVTAVLMCKNCGEVVKVKMGGEKGRDKENRATMSKIHPEVLKERIIRLAAQKHGVTCKAKHELYVDPASLSKYTPDILRGYHKFKEQQFQNKRRGIASA